MKLKCNVCLEGSVVELPKKPNYIDQLICCPNCDKQMAYATEEINSNRLKCQPIDTSFNNDKGFIPVELIEL